MLVTVSLPLAILLSIILSVACTIDTDPNIRFYGAADDGDYEFGYVNMKENPKRMLNITPIASKTVTNRSECAIECFSQLQPPCKSINVRKNEPDGFECSLLPYNRYVYYPHFISEETTEHYEIETYCSYSKPCPNNNYQCVPDDMNGTINCQCKYDYKEPGCGVKKTNSTQVKLINGIATSNPRFHKSSPEGKLSFSLWYSVEENDVNGYVLSFGTSSLCDFLNVKVVSGTLIFGSGEVSIFQSPLQTTQHISVTADLHTKKMKIYLDGILKFSDTVNLPEGSMIYYTMGNKETCSASLDSGHSPKLIYKEVYVWRQVLDEKDIPLLFHKTFLPPDLLSSWSDFIEQAINKVNDFEVGDTNF